VGGGSLIKFAHAQNSGSHMENVDPLPITDEPPVLPPKEFRIWVL